MQAVEAFNEVKRGDKFLTKEEFEEQKNIQLNNLNYKTDGESGFEALERFKKGISEVLRYNEGKTILIVTHGTILNIYFADLLNEYKKLPKRWAKTKFTAYGIIEDGKVIKDII